MTGKTEIKYLLPNPAEQLRNQRRTIDETFGSQYDMVQSAAARRAQAASTTLPLPDTLAQQIAVHAAENGGARAAYEYLDHLTRAVGLALKQKGLKP